MSTSSRARATRRALLALGAVTLVTATLRSPAARAKAPAGHFVDHGDGTVGDVRTGLVWQRYSPPFASFGDLATATAYCDAAVDLPGKGWRLPSVKELLTLMDRNAADTKFFDRDAFPGGSDAGIFWTSTTCKVGQGCAVDQDLHFYVDFTYGAATPALVTARVLCVRSP